MFIVEDDAHLGRRTPTPGVGDEAARAQITTSVLRATGSGLTVVASSSYAVGSLRRSPGARSRIAVELLRTVVRPRRSTVVVAGTSYGTTRCFVEALVEEDLDFVVHVRPSDPIVLATDERSLSAVDLLPEAAFSDVSVPTPEGRALALAGAVLAKVRLPGGRRGALIAGQIGRLPGVHRGTVLAVSSIDGTVDELLTLAVQARLTRPEARKARRTHMVLAEAALREGTSAQIPGRANISTARQQDERAPSLTLTAAFTSRRALISSPAKRLNVVELFAGAGGMGLGFLLARSSRYRIVASAEANPIYVQTLRRNQRHLDGARDAGVVPSAICPSDLRRQEVLSGLEEAARDAGGADLVIGGPPCQGFSMANRNSWSTNNPNNELVEVFFRYVERLQPKIFLMENVQGILWTPAAGNRLSVVDVVEARMRRAGYLVYPKLLDAVWYGVPQHRTRFFLLGIHQDLGYKPSDFGEWGPYPLPSHGLDLVPYVTVRDALADLPAIENGCSNAVMKYDHPSHGAAASYLGFCRDGADEGMITDHVTSRHAGYVLERYKRIPQGGNWRDIVDDMTNYADVSRTHSNIYRRLRWDEPSITIGHYRKSMLIHPEQNRGLSLREAARLQSFPDWFRFVGTAEGGAGGLVHQQQQLANAVCPLVTKAVAEFIQSL